MKIAHILSQNHLTGAESYASQLIQKHQSEGHSVIQISNDFFIKNPCPQISIDIESKGLLNFYKNVLKLRNLLKLHQIQIIHCHSRAASKMAYYARFGLKIGMVSTLHGRQHPSFSKRWHNMYGDFSITVCNNVKKQLLEEFRYNPDKIKNIPNLVSPADFIFKDFKQKKINTDVFKMALIGRATGPKRERTIEFIKNSIPVLESLGRQPEFHVVGSSEISELKDYHIHYHHHVHIDSDYLHQFDLVVGSGRVCIEALLAGVPCLAYGEVKYCGLITPDNFRAAIESNFGDVSDDFTFERISQNKLKSDLAASLNLNYSLSDLAHLAQIVFDYESIQKKVMRLYESAYFYRQYPYWIPTLMYHKIPENELTSPHKIFVTKKNFERHLEIFKKLGMTYISFDDLTDFRNGTRSFSTFPKNPLILTFDDGYCDNLDHAAPILQKYNAKAHLFLLADSSISFNQWDVSQNSEHKDMILSGADRQKWLSTPFIIGSHGHRHQRISELSNREKFSELTGSKSSLEAEFNIPIKTFAFTYGDTNDDAARIAERAGYDYALNTDSGGLTIADNPYAIFRANIFPDETFFSLWKKTRRWYRKYYYIKRKK